MLIYVRMYRLKCLKLRGRIFDIFENLKNDISIKERQVADIKLQIIQTGPINAGGSVRISQKMD